MARKVLNGINWAILGVVLLMITLVLTGDDSLNEGNSSIATLMVVLALTGMIWVPVAFVLSLWSTVLEFRVSEPKKHVLKKPAPYVLAFTLVLLSWMFI